MEVGEVTCRGSPLLSCKRDQIKMRDYSIWTGGLPHLSRLPHLRGVPHLHVNRLLEGSFKGESTVKKTYLQKIVSETDTIKK